MSVGAVRELDRVELKVAVAADRRMLPPGASGTVVTVWALDQVFEVEFTEPFAALVTLERDQVRPLGPDER